MLAFGAFVWETMSTTVTSANMECGADLSLYWSTTWQAEDQDLYDSAPRFSNLVSPTVGYYPNLKSFQATDRKLKQLLNDYPELYIQMILVPDGSTAAGGLTTTHKTYRTQMWETMAARWAAFPTVFWTIANDLTDTTPQALMLGKEISCYFADNRDQTTCNALVYPANFTDYNPWRQNRPLSMGHLRNPRDAFAPRDARSARQAPWHNYITAYTDADISAQHMDGTTPVPIIAPTPMPATDPPAAPSLRRPARAGAEHGGSVRGQYGKPVQTGTPTPWQKWVTNPEYFFRRLFWSQLLSGSGATYGADTTWRALEPYSSATYTVKMARAAGNGKLEGLEDVQYVPKNPATHTSTWVCSDRKTRNQTETGSNYAWLELNRAQVAVRGSQEILAYIPNTLGPGGYTDLDYRRKVSVSSTPVVRNVLMRTFSFPNASMRSIGITRRVGIR